MLFDFFNYLHNNNLDDYLNCYSTFLLTKKDFKNNILKIRMNILIDTYIKFEKKNKFDYLYYYLNNYKDKFFDKPLINYEYNKHSIINDDDDDIDDHYKLMFIKNPEKKIIDYDELDKLYIEEELRKEEEKEYEKLCDLNDDEYYYEDDDCEYYEDNNIYDDEEYYYDEYY